MLGISIYLGLLVLLIYFVFRLWEKESTIVEGVVLACKYEATEPRCYLVIELIAKDIYREYCEFTLSKEEWLSYAAGDKLECEVKFGEFNTIIKSIEKI